MGRNKKIHDDYSGVHMVFENKGGMVLADRVSKQVRDKLMNDPETAMSLVSLDRDGNVVERITTTIQRREVTREQLDKILATGRFSFLIRQTPLVLKQD